MQQSGDRYLFDSFNDALQQLASEALIEPTDRGYKLTQKETAKFMTQTCRLCKQQKKLRNSHILPEFMYQNLYDEEPKRFYTLNVNPDDITKSSKKIQQKGIREFLLCNDCEVLLSKYENYAAETIYAKNKDNKAYIVNASKTDDGQYFRPRAQEISQSIPVPGTVTAVAFSEGGLFYFIFLIASPS